MRQFLKKRALIGVLSVIALVGMVQPAPAAIQNPTFVAQVTPNGVGDLLIFAYWTTYQRDTLLAITNVFAGQARRYVHIEVYEGVASRPVRDFTICLSPGDVWTAAITENANDPDTAYLIVGDPGTCDASVNNAGLTAPPLSGVLVPMNAEFGYIEAYTMECVTGGGLFGGAPGVPAGPPTNCPVPTPQNPGGSPPFGNDDGGDDTLIGTATLVSATAGFSSSYNATSLIGYDAMNESANVHNNTNQGRAHFFYANQMGPISPVPIQGPTNVSTGSTRTDVANALANEAGVSKEILMGRYTASTNFNSSTDVVLTFPTGDFPSWRDAANPLTLLADPVTLVVWDEVENFRFSPRAVILDWEVNICRFFNGNDTASGQVEFECNGARTPGPNAAILSGQGSDFDGGWFRILNNNDAIGPFSAAGNNLASPPAIGDGTTVEFNSINAIPDYDFPVIGLIFSFFEGGNGIFDQSYPIQWIAITGQGGIGNPAFCSPAQEVQGFPFCDGWNIASQYQPNGVPGGLLLPSNDTGFGRNRRSNSGPLD